MKLNKIFTSHMVIPAHKTTSVYGEGKGKATVTFNGITKEFLSEADAWRIEFPPMEYGGPYTMEIDLDGEKTVLDDIYIGEVYLFSGQSNMAFRTCESNTPKEMYEDNSMLRIFSPSKHGTSGITPDDGWTLATKENVAMCSAVGYVAARCVQKGKNIAVGIIVSAQGASVIESWVPKNTFETNGIVITKDGKFADHFEHANDKYYWNENGYLYENSLSEIIPYSLSAVAWYQGESDASRDEAKVYARELKVLIEKWREDFRDPNLPFVVVQIADLFDGSKERDFEAWRLIQEAQLEVQTLTHNVKTVISKDVSETDDIHPKTKHLLAKRVADALMNF